MKHLQDEAKSLQGSTDFLSILKWICKTVLYLLELIAPDDQAG